MIEDATCMSATTPDRYPNHQGADTMTTITIERETLERAVDALECALSDNRAYIAKSRESSADLRAALAATKLCGAPAVGGTCVLPLGHNMGKVDIPTNHQA